MKFYKRIKDCLDKIDLWGEKFNLLMSKLEQVDFKADELSKKIDLKTEWLNQKLELLDQEELVRFNQSVEAMYNRFDYYEGNVFAPHKVMVENYIKNRVLEKQGEVVNHPDYKYICRVHELLKTYSVKNAELKRIGKDNDGGYVMIEPFSTSKIAYSLGICDDVSWDLEMALNGYEIFQYDHTIEALPELNARFHWNKIGLTGEEETETLKHLDTLLAENGHENKNGMVLKMDIEGCEWSVLNQIDSKTLGQFDQIVMEAHDLLSTDSRQTILSALEKLSKTHVVINVHANNNVNVVSFLGKYVTADVIEITMVNKQVYSLVEDSIMVPSKYDQPNNSEIEDIFLGKW